MNKMMIPTNFEIDLFYVFKVLLKSILKARINKYIILIIFFICFLSTSVKNDRSEFFYSYKVVKKKYYWMTEGLYNTIYIKSLKNNLNPLLVSSLINAESGGYKYAVSCANAKGYMQLMPVHTKGRNPFNTNTNITLGCNYLKQCIYKSKYKYGRDIYDSLRMYNQGMNAKRKKYNNWKYVKKIMRHYKILVSFEENTT